jgi:hypothetical protein
MIYESVCASISRRGLFGGAAGLLTAAALPGVALAKGGNVRPLDIMDPRENLYGFAKMWGTIGDKAVLSGYQGVQYAIVGSNRAKPVFGYCGFGNIRNAIQPDGSVRVIGKECGHQPQGG